MNLDDPPLLMTATNVSRSAGRQARIAELEARIGELDAQVADRESQARDYEAQLAESEARVAELEASKAANDSFGEPVESQDIEPVTPDAGPNLMPPTWRRRVADLDFEASFEKCRQAYELRHKGFTWDYVAKTSAANTANTAKGWAEAYATAMGLPMPVIQSPKKSEKT
jgi:hypothetical protein